MSNNRIRWHIVLDIVCLVLLGIADLLIFAIPIKPSQRGFFCDDNSLKKPFQEETVSTWATIAVGFSVSIPSVSTFLKKKLNYDNLPGLIHLFTLENFIDFRNKPTEPTTFKSINMRSNGLVRQLCTCRHFRRVNKGLQVQHFFFALLYGSVNV